MALSIGCIGVIYRAARPLAQLAPRGPTFSEADYPANLKAQQRMIELAGSQDRVIPGHDALQFERYPTQGRVAKIR